MAARFDRDQLQDALDRLGEAAAANETQLDLAVYGGAALMLASRFRYASEDVDIASIGEWPDWLRVAVEQIARDKGWAADWLNDAIQFHLSPAATQAEDHLEFGTYPRRGEPGLRVFVPSAEYLLALKLKAMRVADPVKGPLEARDIRKLMAACGLTGIDDAIAILGHYFPRSAADADKQRFLLKHVLSQEDPDDDPPDYPVRDL